MHVYLIGMPGAGKSTIGKALAQTLERTFVDLDNAIEKIAGLTIPEIFTDKEEAFFRELESEALKTVSFSGQKLVVATGGGTPCFLNNLAFMQQHGYLIYLKTSPEILAARLHASPLSFRPLLKDKSESQLLSYLKQTLTAREPFYEKAGIIIAPGPVSETVAIAAHLICQAEQAR